MTPVLHSLDVSESALLAHLTDGEGVAYATDAFSSIKGRFVEAQDFYLRARNGDMVRIGTRWIDLPRGERVAALEVSSADLIDGMSSFEFAQAWIKTIRVVSAANWDDGARIDAAIELTSHTNERFCFQIADLHDQETAVLLLTESLQLNRDEVRDLVLQ